MIVLSQEEQNVAANVKRLIDEQDPPLSMRALESRAGWSEGSLRKFLAGHHSPRFSMVWRLAEELDVSIEELARKPRRKAIPA